MFFKKQVLLLAPILLSLWDVSLYGIDITPFYRATLFQGEAKRNVSKWTTHLDAQYAQGSTHRSWNTAEARTQLFNQIGPCNLKTLAVNLDNLDAKPKTKAYALGPIPNLYDGTMIFNGHLHVEECNLTYQQNLICGLYVQGYFPIRQVKLDDIDFVQSVTTDSEQVTLVNFINNDLDPILEENNLKPLKTPFKKTQLSDTLVSLGWQGHCTFTHGALTALRGFLQAGVLIPCASTKSATQVFSLPLGYNKHWGTNFAGNLHATFWDKLVLGLDASATVLFKRGFDQRMTTSTDQNGWIMLGRGTANTDEGTIWNGTVYLKGERLFGGFSALAGYSYTQQEETDLNVEDDNFLPESTGIDRNHAVNSNKLLAQRYQHVLHLFAQYDFGAHNIATSPALTFEYDYPILGKHALIADMLSGTASLAINWNF